MITGEGGGVFPVTYPNARQAHTEMCVELNYEYSAFFNLWYGSIIMYISTLKSKEISTEYQLKSSIFQKYGAYQVDCSRTALMINFTVWSICCIANYFVVSKVTNLHKFEILMIFLLC